MAPVPRVVTIPAAVPFLPTLARALLDGRLVPGFEGRSDPLALADATIYLPTRRACRLARDAVFDALGSEAAVLPRLVALGDIDDDAGLFDDDEAGEAGDGAVLAGGAEALSLPPALSGAGRRLLLARLVLVWSERLRRAAGDPPLLAATPASALALADLLARLMDDLATRGVSWTEFDGLAPSEYDAYWDMTLTFLKIVRAEWPGVLAARGAIEPAVRRDRTILQEAARLAARAAAGREDGPVIVAGSTGSMPATAEFIATIAGLPNGAVVLPGLDTVLDEDSWAAIAGGAAGGAEPEPESGHPQFAMYGLLRRLAITRADVAILGAPPAHDRAVLVSEALRPAPTTHLWRARLAEPPAAAAIGAGLAALSVIEAAHPEEEALAIAVVLRQALERRDAVAALATPDRALARRVVAALERWDVAVSDTGGERLADTPPGVFARLVAEVALAGVPPVPLLALLKHPLARLGSEPDAFRAGITALEIAVLRGPRPRSGTAGLAHALATKVAARAALRRGERSALHPSDPTQRLPAADLVAAEEIARRLGAALRPLEGIDRRRAFPLRDLAAAHRAAIRLCAEDASGDVAAFAGRDGEALADALDELIDDPASADFLITADDYPDFFAAGIAERVVRRPPVAGARVQILGLLEARLVQADVMVLGGLAEAIWPPRTPADPWLARGMRLALGLDLPERRIGLSAHDFAQLLGAAPTVVLTRAAKSGGAPAVASRFWRRLAAVAGASWAAAERRGAEILALARRLDRPSGAPRRAERPEPRPPLAARPTSLSVTEIEHWLRDPYTIYAKHILKLEPLDPVDQAPGAKDRGTALHEAIGRYTQAHPAALPADPLGELLRIGRETFADLEDYPEARAFWWPRFEAIARAFVTFDAARRAGLTRLDAEIRGEITIPLGARSFRLRGRADRIERFAEGDHAILDFKTGTPPSLKQVRLGLAPQLPLEAAMLREDGFAGLPGGAVREFAFVRLGGSAAPVEPMPVVFKDITADELAIEARAKLETLIRRFEDETMPYRSLVRSMWKTRYGSYDALARVQEWATGDGGEG